MRRSALFAVSLAATTVAHAGRPVSREAVPAPQAVAGSFQLAQACGWYAISFCSRGRGDARIAANAYGGYVIDTGSEAYPNFRPGWYCAVEGPMSRDEADRRMLQMRDDGAASAYIKNGC